MLDEVHADGKVGRVQGTSVVRVGKSPARVVSSANCALMLRLVFDPIRQLLHAKQHVPGTGTKAAGLMRWLTEAQSNGRSAIQ